jgi:5-formyltetrahydrofolate cyclo-ligase
MAKSDIPTAKSIAHIDKSQGDDRKALRATCLERRNTIDPGLKLQYDTAIIARLIDWLDKHPPAKQSDALLALWWPIGSEPDWRSFASQLRRLGWQLALPCVTGKNLPLSFARYDEDTVLRCAGLGIFEPAQVQRIQPWIIAAPCVGFFKNYRLGYGGGYYDRSLAQLDDGARKRTIAVAYSACEVVFEPEAHDIAFATLITESPTTRDQARAL